jgi:hypothetical protein
MMQLGPLLNGFVIYGLWLPVPTMNFPGVMNFIKKYQAKAATEGVDPLGYFVAPWAYAELEVSGKRWLPPKVSTTISSPTTFTIPSSKLWSATSNLGSTVNGHSPVF